MVCRCLSGVASVHIIKGARLLYHPERPALGSLHSSSQAQLLGPGRGLPFRKSALFPLLALQHEMRELPVEQRLMARAFQSTFYYNLL